MSRSLLGIVITTITVGLLIMAAGRFFAALEERAERSERTRPQQERVLAVKVDRFDKGQANPVMTAYGEIASWRSLELRASTGGTLTEISDVFRDGGSVGKGDLLFLIDPADARSARDRAATELATSEAELADARANIASMTADLSAAQEQRDLRSSALERQRSLRSRGVSTDAGVESAALALSQAEQTLIGRQQARSQADVRVQLAKIQVQKQTIALADAERTLAETRYEAPFDGLLSNVNAVLGRLVNANENLGTLIDPTALEVAFRVSNDQFSRLLDQSGSLKKVPVSVSLNLSNRMLNIDGRIDRAGAEVGTGQTGRLLYAVLEVSPAQILRPGDFVTVTINEPTLSDVSEIPASAISEDGLVLVVGPENRLRETRVDILRRQRDTVIVANAPWNSQYVVGRSPQLGAGLRIKPIPSDPNDAPPPVDEFLELDADRRAKLTAFVEKSDRMPDDVKKRLLARLAEPKVPRAMVERLESRIGG